MPIKTFGPYKLKNKPNRRGFRISNPDGSPMTLHSVSFRKGLANNEIYVDMDWVDLDADKQKAE